MRNDQFIFLLNIEGTKTYFSKDIFNFLQISWSVIIGSYSNLLKFRKSMFHFISFGYISEFAKRSITLLPKINIYINIDQFHIDYLK